MPTTMTRPSFDEYVIARSAMLLRFGYLLCGDRHLAEDLVQEVLIKAHRRWSAIEAENPDAYLKRALVRTHVTWLRRRASGEITTDTLREVPSGAAFDDEHAAREETWAMLARLPRAQRAVLVLRYFEDLDDARISELIGVSASTVRTHAHRGLATLRETLAEHAAQAPTGAGLLDSVQRGASRAAARRRIATIGGLAALVAAVALGLPLLLRESDVPPVDPSPSVSVSPPPTTTLVLVPTALAPPEFPYALEFLPAGLQLPTVDLVPFDPREPGIALRFGEALSISVGTTPAIQGDWGEGTVVPVTVDGATRASLGGSGRVLTWERDGLYFIAGTDGTLSSDDLIRVAEGLRPGNTTGTVLPIDAITGIALPAGYVRYERSDNRACFDPPPGPLGSVCVTLRSRPPSRPDDGVFDIDGDPAYTRDARTLVVERADSRVVTITYDGDELDITTADLVAIYRSLTFGD
jgi:RNA polymerase sigma-70 factor (sigma-E family)